MSANYIAAIKIILGTFYLIYWGFLLFIAKKIWDRCIEKHDGLNRITVLFWFILACMAIPISFVGFILGGNLGGAYGSQLSFAATPIENKLETLSGVVVGVIIATSILEILLIAILAGVGVTLAGFLEGRRRPRS